MTAKLTPIDRHYSGFLSEFALIFFFEKLWSSRIQNAVIYS